VLVVAPVYDDKDDSSSNGSTAAVRTAAHDAFGAGCEWEEQGGDCGWLKVRTTDPDVMAAMAAGGSGDAGDEQ
jgi:hypothetical protein